MAKQIGTVIRPFTGKVRNVYGGYSWTTLFFGFFPAALRGDGFGTVIGLGMSLLGIFLADAMAPIAMVIPWGIWAAMYNESHMNRLYRNGYVLEPRPQEFLPIQQGDPD